MESWRPSIVIGVDFGMTFSGIAYSCRRDRKDIRCTQNWQDHWSTSTANEIPSSASSDVGDEDTMTGVDHNDGNELLLRELLSDLSTLSTVDRSTEAATLSRQQTLDNIRWLLQQEQRDLQFDFLPPGNCVSQQEQCSYLLASVDSFNQCLTNHLNADSTSLDSSFRETMVDQNLSVDIKNDDWHLFFSQEEQQQQQPSGHFGQSLILRLFSEPTCCNEARYLRCARSELEDVTSWLWWQQLNETKISQGPSWSFLETADGQCELSEEELIRCRRTLLLMLQSRSIEEIQLVLLAVYLTTHSFRRLFKSEWIAAIRAVAKMRFGTLKGISEGSCDHFPEGELLDICSPILKADESDQVVFEELVMEKYLRAVELPGLDSGHGSMTQMCFDQIKQLGTQMIVRPWHGFCRWFKSCTEWPLLKYVSNFWYSHYKLAAETRNDLTAELFRMINDALAGTSPTETPVMVQQKVVDTGYSIAQIYNLPWLAELYCNLGASDNASTTRSSLLALATGANLLWQVGSVPETGKYDNVTQVTKDSNFVYGKADSEVITSQLYCTHLDSYDDEQLFSDDSSEEHLSPFTPEGVEGWECIENTAVENMLEPDGQSFLDDWEYVRNRNVTLH